MAAAITGVMLCKDGVGHRKAGYVVSAFGEITGLPVAGHKESGIVDTFEVFVGTMLAEQSDTGRSLRFSP